MVFPVTFPGSVPGMILSAWRQQKAQIPWLRKSTKKLAEGKSKDIEYKDPEATASWGENQQITGNCEQPLCSEHLPMSAHRLEIRGWSVSAFRKDVSKVKIDVPS